MDFKNILRPVQFGKAPGTVADVPKPIIRQQSSNRRLAMLREADQALAVLPGPGQSLHAIMTGRYDLCDLLDIILDRMGTVAHLRIATLSFNARNVRRMTAWTEAGTVQKLALLCSHFFREHNPEIFEQVREALAPPHRLAASRNHCKVICFHFAAGDMLVMESSANLRSNANREQFALFNDPALHEFHSAWIDDEVRKNEGEQNNAPGTR